VIRVSVETVRVVKGLPEEYGGRGRLGKKTATGTLEDSLSLRRAPENF
jgi:hypothetical protein